MRKKIISTLSFVALVGMVAGCSTANTNTAPRHRVATTPAPSDSGGAPHPVEDAALTTKVKTKLMSNDILNGLKIDVDTQSGVVYLSGVVDSAEQKKTAVEIARNTAGVQRVEDNLKVGKLQSSSQDSMRLSAGS